MKNLALRLDLILSTLLGRVLVKIIITNQRDNILFKPIQYLGSQVTVFLIQE